MKELLKIVGIFALFVTLIPMLGFFSANKNTLLGADTSIQAETDNSVQAVQAQPTEQAITDDEFIVLDFTSGQVLTMTMEEYVIGAVLGEMPATYNIEALKAQAVAAHTYAIRRKEQQLISPDPTLMGAYISNDSTKYQAFFTPEQAKDFYGSGYDEYYTKVSTAVKDVIGEILVYNNEPIVAAFHSSSSGITESAENIWGNPIDYLVPVDSSEDKDSPTYSEDKTFTSDELSARLNSSDYDITLQEDTSEWLKINSVSTSGTVTEIAVGDKVITGMELRTLLSLRSACFQVSYDKDSDSFTFTTHGNGHGVGLSQYGANAMAESGSTYREILLHYYKGAELITIDE